MGGVGDAEIVPEIGLLAKEDGEVVVADGGGLLDLSKVMKRNIVIVVAEVRLNQNGDAFLDGRNRLGVM